jgi:hypothetical protein
MKAFITFLTITVIFFIFAMIGTVSGVVPPAKPLTFWLVLLALLTVGAKFVVAETLSSDGFQLNKASTDISLAALSAVCSLAVVQSIKEEAIFQGPAILLMGINEGVEPSTTQTLIAGWLLTAVSLVLFAVCLAFARWGRQPSLKGWKKPVSELICAAICCFSFSSYLITIFFKS